MKPIGTKVVEMSIDEIKRLIEEAELRPLTKEEGERLLAIALSYHHLGEMLADKGATITRLRKMLFGPTSEKTDVVVGESGAVKSSGAASSAIAESGDGATQDDSDGPLPKEPRKGHGRNAAEDYVSATCTCVSHETLRAGEKCPQCGKGRLHKLAEPAVMLRVSGGPPLHAHVWKLDRLRCNLCSQIFTAKGPAGLGEEKYDATAASMIGLLRYGTGLPFNRLEGLQGNLGIPLPTSTQWDIVKACAHKIAPAFVELSRQAAQGEVVHNDDTSMEILALRAWLRDRPVDEDDERNGIFTTGIVARVEDRRIALFFTGRQHAGENLAHLLRQRDVATAPPVQMCDGLSRNLPKQFAVVLGNCLAHGRRQFVNVVDNFPAECRVVLEKLREVYRVDADAKKQRLSAAQRLLLHQAHSGQVMAELKLWLEAQIAERKTEPNSGLGKAIAYLLKRWQPLTLFLREPDAPLDNNVCEQALKKAIVHRKNSLFYRTENGARVGDMFMSLIHTAELCGANPFDYLSELQRHAPAVARDPAAWMPWNYRAACAPAERPG
jgi:transposase